MIKTKKMLIALACMSVLSGPVVAQDADTSGTNLSDGPATMTPAAKAVENVTLGYRLAEYAREADDPRAMLVAAKLVGTATLKESDEKGTLESEQGASKDASGATTSSSAADLYAEAKEMAQGDIAIEKAVEDAQAAASKGVVGGAVKLAQYVPGQTIWNVSFNARGGEPLLVGTKRGSAADVDLKVYDQNGNLVCQDMSHNTVLMCRVNPIWSGKFMVKVINHGGSGSAIALVTN